MKFKSLMIHGFKSFADKTLIELPSGITAIVGPNGSGKSNIMDCLRWVLGEQRASELRGGDMEDVIFAGSVNRKPSGYAEVALTLSDIPIDIANKWGTFSDITVSRKIYRTGEREYFINNRKCRLKDVKDIFFDTGLGSKSISIIEQERVTKIVNSTPEELRYFLEETAGVVRYKERRKEAETRLRQTADNLSRINDLLSVMVGDLDKLESQVQQVLTYKKLRKEKTELEIVFFCQTYAKLVKETENHKKSFDQLMCEEAGLVADNQGVINKETALRKEQEELRTGISEKRKLYESQKEILLNAEAEIKQLNGYLTSAQTQSEQIKSDLAAHEARLDEIEERLDNVISELEDIEELISDFDGKAGELSEQNAELKAELDNAGIILKELNSAYLAAMQENTRAGNSISMKQSEIAGFEASLMRLQREKDNLDGDSGDLQEKLDDAVKNIAALTIQIEHATTREAQAREELNDTETKLNDTEQELSEVDVELKTLQKQSDFIKNELETKFAGESASKILKKYSGMAYTSIVKSDEAYILYPDLIVIDDEYKDLILNDIEKYSFSFRFIFKSMLKELDRYSGMEKISPSLYLTSGIYKKTGKDDPAVALAAMRKDYEKISEKINILLEKQNTLIEERNFLKTEVKDIKSFRDKYLSEIKNLEKEYAAFVATKENITGYKDRTAKHLEILDKEMQLALSGIESAKNALEELRTIRQQSADELYIVEEKRKEAEEFAHEISEKLENIRQQLSSAQRDSARYHERKKALDSELKQLSKDKVLGGGLVLELKNRLEELSSGRMGDWKAQLEQAEITRKEYSTIVLLTAEEIDDMEKSMQNMESHVYELREKLSELNNALHAIDLKKADSRSKTETAENNMQSIALELENGYGMNINDVWQQYSNKAPGKNQLSLLMKETDEKIESLGALNMAAESEYLQKREEYEKQTEQQTDITQAVTNLKELIDEIDESTVNLFTETFNAVRKNFIDVFTRFFGSGNADITLTDPQNMLTTGVELTVNPPGKKVSHKNLLSGGEKALSALTLLFALFLQKPTPFCFLDEVDAPLDDVNVARFIQMVRSMSNHTQFVIITHKHQTMASANSLYGVTMQEGGISSMLSVQLNNK